MAQTQFHSTFGTMVRDEMNKQKVDTLTLTRLIAENTEKQVSYDHVRKAVKGDLAPSKFLIEAICKVLHMDKDRLSSVVAKDRLSAKLGTKALSLALNVKEEVVEINNLWDDLAQNHRDDILMMIRNFARQDRQTTANRKPIKRA